MVCEYTMTTFNHYAAVQDLILRLEREGFAAGAEDLRLAVEGGATGTEIFMALRFHLLGIIKRGNLIAETRQSAMELVTKLEEGLR